MTSDFGTLPHLEDVKTGHDLVVMQFSHFFSGNLQSWDLAPCPYHIVFFLILANNYVFGDNVSNSVQLCLYLRIKRIHSFLMFFDLSVHSLGFCFLLLTLVLPLRLLHDFGYLLALVFLFLP